MNKVKNHHQIEALLSGDKTIIRLLYDELYPKVTSFVLKNRGSFHDAEELFQNALFQLITRAKVKGIKINTTLEAYLFSICKNLWYQELNKRKKEVRSEHVFEQKNNDAYHLASILHQDRWDLFEEMFLKLSTNCQELLKKYFAKVSYDVIIKKFNYATKNVAFQRIFKCKKRLTELVKEDKRYRNL